MTSEIKQKSVLLALSGGVDSSVAALLLKKQGYRVIATFMKNYSGNKNPLTGECNWVEEWNMAKKVSSILQIPLIKLDFEKQYSKLVLKPMFKAYAEGLTPNPDTLCNTLIKFPLLWEKAQRLKCDFIATGHYARIQKKEDSYSLLAGKDKNKDQSYFLCELSQLDLSHTLFPVGNLTKEEVRKIAKENNLPNWDKKGTRGICFVGKTNMKSFLQNKIPVKKGKVSTPEGKDVGVHPGAAYFTIGERIGPSKDITISTEYINETKSKLYVSDKRGNTLIIAPQGHPSLKKSIISLKSVHFINPHLPIPQKLKARIRHLGPLLSGKLIKSTGKYKFRLSKPLEAIAPGQVLVLYHNSLVIGGAEIIKAD